MSGRLLQPLERPAATDGRQVGTLADGTSRRLVRAERREFDDRVDRRHLGLQSVDSGIVGLCVHTHSHFKLHSVRRTKPMGAKQSVSNMVRETQAVGLQWMMSCAAKCGAYFLVDRVYRP